MAAVCFGRRTMDPPRAGLTLPGTRGGEGTSMWDLARLVAILIIIEGLVMIGEGLVLVGRSRGWLRDY